MLFACCVNALEPELAIAERKLGNRYAADHTDRVAESVDKQVENQARVSSASSVAKSFYGFVRRLMLRRREPILVEASSA